MNNNQTSDLLFHELEVKCKTLQNKCNYTLPDSGYAIMHLDGRGFSKLIKKRFNLPFDPNFSNIMDETAKYLAAHISGCKCAYVQSDEITLIIHNAEGCQPFFGHRLCKVQSIAASICSGKFILEYLKYESTKMSMEDCHFNDNYLFQFDCKIWDVPTYNDVIEWLIYRQKDCVRNSKQQMAQTYLSHKQLLNLNVEEQITLLKEIKGLCWHIDIPDEYKTGRIIWKEFEEKINEFGIFQRSVWKVHTGVYFNNPDKLKAFENLKVIPKE